MADETKQENIALAKQMTFNGGGIEVKTLGEAKLLAETFISSQLVPKSFDTAAKVIVAIQAGREMGFGFWEALTKLHVVNGRIGMEAKAMKAKAITSGKCKLWKEEKIGESGKPSEGYKIIIERTDGQSGEVSFTMQEAMTAKLADKDNWRNYRDDMLWNRTVSKCCRRWFDDTIFTCYTPEELESPPPETAYDPTTPKRADREPAKPAQDVKVSDASKPDTTEILQKIVDAIVKRVSEKYGVDLTEEQVKQIMLIWATIEIVHLFKAAGVDTDENDPSTWSFDFCEKFLDVIEDTLLPIPLEIEAIFKPPEPPKAENALPQTENEKIVNPDEGRAEEIKPKMWICTALGCGATFDKSDFTKPSRGKPSTPKCPSCGAIGTTKANKREPGE